MHETNMIPIGIAHTLTDLRNILKGHGVCHEKFLTFEETRRAREKGILIDHVITGHRWFVVQEKAIWYIECFENRQAAEVKLVGYAIPFQKDLQLRLRDLEQEQQKQKNLVNEYAKMKGKY